MIKYIPIIINIKPIANKIFAFSLKIKRERVVLKIGPSEKIIDVLLAPIYLVLKAKHKIIIPQVKNPMIGKYQ